MQVWLGTETDLQPHGFETGDIAHKLQRIAQALFADDDELFAWSMVAAIPLLDLRTSMRIDLFCSKSPSVFFPSIAVVTRKK